MDAANLAAKIIAGLLGGALDGLGATIVCGLMIRIWEEGRPNKGSRTPEEEEAFNRYFRRTVASVGISVGILCTAAGALAQLR
jgi:hypothetical protein